MKVLVVLNPGSGSASDATPAQLAETLRPLGPVTFAAPPEERFDVDLRTAAEGAGLVVAAGGDGTVSGTVNALADRLDDIAFAVLPLGTGNDLARTLGIPEDPLEAAGAVASGAELEIDVWRAAGTGADRLFVNACVGGFPVAVDEAVSDGVKRVLGPVAYLVAGARAAARMERFAAAVGGRRADDCVAVGVGNGRTVGGGIPLFPEADPADGRLEACALPAPGTADAARLGLAVRKGEHGRLEGVVTASGREVRIETEPAVELNVDGELVGLRTPVSFSAAGRARFLVPVR
ncbi:MAG TPA: diacylglycerol kinase family protein [Actinomycetota bacterium]